jgi:hypothetical protein
MALRQVGGALGVAVLGSLASGAYTGRLDLTGVPAELAGAAGDSVGAGMAVADQLGSAALAESVATAYVHAMDVVLLATAVVAVLGATAAAMFLPARGTADPTQGTAPAAKRPPATIAA